MATIGKTLQCKAAVVWEFNKPLKIETINVKPPGFGEVRVKMVAVSLCHTDVGFWKGYMPYQPLPFIIGHEGAGIVESVGEGVTTLVPGDKILTLCLPHCRKCDICKGNKSNFCRDFGRTKSINPLLRFTGYDGIPKFSINDQTIYHFAGTSAFTEYSVIPENSCAKINPKAQLEEVCLLACGFPTGYGAATNAVNMEPGETAAIWGLGCVGLSAIVGCKAKNLSKIIAVDIDSNKEPLARKMGCTDFVNPKDVKSVPEAIKELTKNTGVDFAFVCVGNTDAMEQAVASTTEGGTTNIVGFCDSSSVLKISPTLLLPSRKITGSTLGDYKLLDDIPKLVDLYMEGKLPLADFITGKFKLQDINKTIELITSGQSIRSVIIM